MLRLPYPITIRNLKRYTHFIYTYKGTLYLCMYGGNSRIFLHAPIGKRYEGSEFQFSVILGDYCFNQNKSISLNQQVGISFQSTPNNNG